MSNNTKPQEDMDAVIDSASNVGGGFFEGNGYTEGNEYTDNDSVADDQLHQDDANEIEYTDDAMQGKNASSVTKNAASEPKRGMGKSTKILIGAVGVVALFILILIMTMQQQSGEPLSEQQPDAEMSLNDVQNDAIVNTAPPAPNVATASDPLEASTTVDADTPTGAGVQDYIASILDEQDARFRDLESRVTHIEEFLSQLAKQQSSSKQKTKKPKTSTVNKPNTVKRQSDNQQGVDNIKSNETVSVAPTVKPVPRVICTYLGGLNNRAWVSCDGELYSIKKGDVLPHPYGTITIIDDSSGTVTTSGGVIR